MAAVRTHFSASELQLLANRAEVADHSAAVVAAAVLDGMSRTTTANRQTLHDWVRRFNANGLAG